MARLTRLTVFTFVAIAAMLLSACWREEPQALIGVSQCSADDWRTKMNDEMAREAAFIGRMQLHFRCAYDDSRRQCADIDSFIREGVKLLIVSPNEAVGVTPAIRRARAAGIRVIQVDRRTSTPDYDAYIGADNYDIGYKAGRYAASILRGRGRVAELTGLRGSTPADDRHRGFLAALKETPGLTFINSTDAAWQADRARHITDSLIRHTGLPAPDLVFAHNDRMAASARSAFAAMPGVRMPAFIGVDALSGRGRGVDSVLCGAFAATVIYPTGGYQAIQVADSLLRGFRVSRERLLPVAVIDSANVHVADLQMKQIADEEARINNLNHRVGTFWQRYSHAGSMLLGTLIIVLLICIIAAMLLRSYRNKVKINRELSRQRDELQLQKSQLEEKTERLTGQTDKLARQKLELETQSATLAQQKRLLESHKKTLLSQRHVLEQQKISLEEQTKQLHAQTEQLRQQAERLSEQNDKLVSQRTQLAVLSERLEQAEDRNFLTDVRDTIRLHLADPDFGVGELAEAVCLSRAQLFRKVKEGLGCSPVELLRTARLKRAAELLNTTDMSISQICFATGFSSPSYFTKCYKDYFDAPPHKFKKKTAAPTTADAAEG